MFQVGKERQTCRQFLPAPPAVLTSVYRGNFNQSHPLPGMTGNSPTEGAYVANVATNAFFRVGVSEPSVLLFAAVARGRLRRAGRWLSA